MRDSQHTCKLDKLECVFLLFKQISFINMKKLENLLLGMIIGGLICMLVFALTSCSSSRGNYWTSTKVCDHVRKNFVGYK